jgi:PAS domain S-box-containing protein
MADPESHRLPPQHRPARSDAPPRAPLVRPAAELPLSQTLRWFDQLTTVVVVTDENGRIVYVNPCFEAVTGYTAPEAVGRTPRVLKSGVQGPEFYADMWATVRSGGTWHGELVNRRKDGSLYLDDMSIVPAVDRDSGKVRFIATKKDIGGLGGVS